MNFILLKNKDRFVKSDCKETLFPDLGLDDSKIYDPRSSLDGVKWFFIENVSNKEYFNEILKETNSVSYPLVNDSTFKNSSIILEFQDRCVAMQNITPSKYFRKRTLRSSGEVDEGEGKIILDDVPNAVYDQNTDRIYFKDLSKVKIMPDIILEYREATQEEVDSFADSYGIVFTGDYSSNSVKTRNRRLLSLVSNKMNTLTEEKLSELIDYAKSYLPNLVQTDRFTVTNEKELKELLYAFDERIYTTPVTKEKRIAGSVDKL